MGLEGEGSIRVIQAQCSSYVLYFSCLYCIIYNRTSVARILMARLPRLLRNRS